MTKIFTVSFIRDLESQVSNDEISYSRMVEIMNEHVEQYHQQQLAKMTPSEQEIEKLLLKHIAVIDGAFKTGIPTRKLIDVSKELHKLFKEQTI